MRAPKHKSENRLLQETRVYLMSNFPVFWKSKFGISDNTTARRANVSDTTFGLVFTVLSFDLPFGKKLEGLVHWIYRELNKPFRRGSGRTEWFLNINPLFGLFFVWLMWRTGLRPDWYVWALAFFTPFVWLEGLLWLLLFRFLGWALCVFLLFLIDKLGGFGIFEAALKFAFSQTTP